MCHIEQEVKEPRWSVTQRRYMSPHQTKRSSETNFKARINRGALPSNFPHPLGVSALTTCIVHLKLFAYAPPE